jgi:SAM-dependent methyltransferase
MNATTPSRYYDLPFAKAAFEARLSAIERATVPGSAMLDVGCHDGRIARHLLAVGRASRVTAIDIDTSLIAGDVPQNLTFRRVDITVVDLRELGRFDLVLALNIVHHLAGESRAAAKMFVQSALDISSAVLIDMGSFSERGRWSWRRRIERYWGSDLEMWGDLFGAAPRQEILRYDAMGGGERVMWRLEGRSEG